MSDKRKIDLNAKALEAAIEALAGECNTCPNDICKAPWQPAFDCKVSLKEFLIGEAKKKIAEDDQKRKKEETVLKVSTITDDKLMAMQILARDLCRTRTHILFDYPDRKSIRLYFSSIAGSKPRVKAEVSSLSGGGPLKTMVYPLAEFKELRGRHIHNALGVFPPAPEEPNTVHICLCWGCRWENSDDPNKGCKECNIGSKKEPVPKEAP